jgi:cyclohexanecarboxylate-CoA ligase
MLPNWIEYATLIFGINELGAIYAGIPVTYGERQAAAILRSSKAKVLVIPRRWRSGEHLQLSRLLRAELPTLEQVLVLDEDGSDLGEGEHLWSSFANIPRREFTPGDPSEICYFGFTSGTTGEPKGAMHTHESLIYSTHQLAEHVGRSTFGEPMIQLVASPTGHHTGFIWGVLFTVYIAGTGVHVDRWDPAWGVDIIRNEKVTAFFGAPTFLQDMMRTDLAGDPECPLRCVVVAGSSVPRNLPAQASHAFGAYIAPAWGMTECSIIVSCTPSASAGILRTDGSVFEGSEARVVDGLGADMPTGVTGELLVRGPALFVGYYERPDATMSSFLSGGWFRTGDTAAVDEHGWLLLRGRTKDIIIRGGENIPVTEIETVLFDHPDILNAAVVGVHDERLGERACAVVVPKPGVKLDLTQLCEFLTAQGLSKHYLPERLVLLEELPVTQSGKIQKFKLREMVSSGGM